MKLSELKIGENCIITKIDCDKSIKSRLNDLGVVDGVKVSVIRFSPLFDPIEIKVRESYLAVRKSLADKIEVKLC